MKRKPIQILVDKVGKQELAKILDVDLSLIYLWIYRESGRVGRRPGLANALELERLGEKYGIKSLTIEYLARL